MAEAKTRLSVRDLRKVFQTEGDPVEVLRGISFDLEAGENLVITGPSGSGKSTLLHLIGTLDTPTSGSIHLAEENPFGLSERDLATFRSRNIGFIFQDHHLLPQYDVVENVLIPTYALPEKDSKAPDRALELLRRVGLEHRLTHRPAALSGGERQRVAVARALINQPTLLLADEPTGNLDQKTALSIAELLFELHRQEKTLLIAVTHSLELASLFSRRCELKEGQCSPA